MTDGVLSTSERHKSQLTPPVGAVVVVGGGIGGIQASLDLADSGFKVYLVEKDLSIGGTMSQLDKTFPTNDCAMCIMSPKLVEAGRHTNIEILSLSRVERVEGRVGAFRVLIRKMPRYVDLQKCTACGDCAKVCPVRLPDDYEEGLVTRRAIYQPFAQSMPSAFGIDKRGTPPCRAACPIHVNAQGYIALITEEKYEEALTLIREKNPFPGITGRICTHPCEKACRRGEVDQPVAINGLKRFLADRAGETPIAQSPRPEHREQIAVVGSGPAGLLAAHDLRQMGYGVTVFEALPVLGGMLSVGIPEYRLPRHVVSREIGILQQLGVEFRVNTRVGNDVTLKRLRGRYQAVFLAVGAHVSHRLVIDGENLEGVIHATDYLRRVNLGEVLPVGPRVAVVGGGNAAIDAARVARRQGASRVLILYRRSREEMPALPEEIEAAESEGIIIELLAAPTGIQGKNGRISKAVCVRMKLGEPDDSGRRRPVPVQGSQFTFELDTLILAIGQTPDISFIHKQDPLKITRGGTIEVDPVTLETSARGVFAGGDAVTGPLTYIDAMAAGRKAAVSIDRYLRGEELGTNRGSEGPQTEYVRADIEGVPPHPRSQTKTLTPSERVQGFQEVDLGLTEAQVRDEAIRCLQCGGCSDCLQCVQACEAQAIIHDMNEEMREIEAGAIILTPGFDEFDPRPKSEYGYGRFPNVVTSIEFERCLSAAGPFGGHPRRPSDGQHPKSIGWVQCVGSRDPHRGVGYCSSVCCMAATKQAVVAREHAPDLEATIFYMDMRAHGKDFDRYVERARDVHGVRYVRSRISNVTEDPQHHDLFVTYETEDGHLVRERLDMAVLSVGLLPPQSASELSRILEVRLNPHGFADTSWSEPLRTNRPGVFAAGAFSGPKDVPETVVQGSAAAAQASALLAESRGTLVSEIERPPEVDVRYARPRIGVFVCHCGINIGGVVSVSDVAAYAATLPFVVHVEDNLYTCSQDSQGRIKKAILDHRLNRVVVASCSPRTHEALFQDTLRAAGLNRYLLEMANIRDQCSWVHMNWPREATEKAKDLVRMAVSKAALLEPLPTVQIPVNPRGLVVGGGIAGLTSAIRLADQGYHVDLVEIERELGGNLRHMATTLEGEDPQFVLARLVDVVSSHQRIHVFLDTRIESITGFVGNFKTSLTTQEGPAEREHGVIIVATGAREMKTREYLCGQDERVVTQREFESLLHHRPSALGDQKSELTVCMIQCVGSRTTEHPYCSRVCCSQAIKNALALAERFPRPRIFILYRDIRTYGFKEDDYQKAREQGAFFVRFDPERKPVVQKQNGHIQVSVYDPLLQDHLVLTPDWLVLSVGIEPLESNEHVARMLKVPLNADRFFLEAHMKLRPVEFATEGVYVAGMAHGPKSTDEAIVQAEAAVSRSCTVLSKETIEVPGTVARVDERKCVACGLCEEICPYHAIELVTKKTMAGEKPMAQVNEALCKGCGLCTASCRSGAIDLTGFSDEEIVAQIAQVSPH